MFLSVILTIAAAYMALQCGLTAFSVPFASWTWLSWLYLAMAAVMIGVCVVSARRAVRAYKKQAEKIKEEQARELEKLHAKRRARCIWTRTSTLRPRPRRPKPRAWPPRRRRPQEQTRRTAARTTGKAAKPPKRRTAATIDPRRARQRDAPFRKKLPCVSRAPLRTITARGCLKCKTKPTRKAKTGTGSPAPTASSTRPTAMWSRPEGTAKLPPAKTCMKALQKTPGFPLCTRTRF